MNGLFDSIGIPCIPKDWRLFIISSSRSLKGVLHQNANRYLSIPLAHLMHLEENYTNVKTLLIALKCDQFNWQVVRDFRMTAFLVGLQGGFTKFPSYLCHWDSQDTTAHYHRRVCRKRTEYSVGYSNIKWDPFIDLIKILLPPLHINLGFIKQFV